MTLTFAEMLSNAFVLAATKHAGQFDTGGNPYFMHVSKVMHYLKSDDMELMAVAILHDVVEDTDVTFSQLAEMGFSDRIVTAVRLLTKMPGQTVREYIDGIKTNIDAVRVKLCDLRHNTDVRRLKGITEKDFDRMQKYHKIYMELKELV